jgi:hypothetical protein
MRNRHVYGLAQQHDRMSAVGLNRVKTRGRSIAIKRVSRSRPFEVLVLQADSILKLNLRISFSSRFEFSSFHTA